MAVEWDPINRVYTVVPKNRQVVNSPAVRQGQTQAAVKTARAAAPAGVSAISAPEGAKGRVGIPATKKPSAPKKNLNVPQGPALFGTADQPYSQVQNLINDADFADNTDTSGLLESILATIGGGGSGRNDARDYARAMQAAKRYETAGLAAQQQYGTEAERAYQAMLARVAPQYEQMRTDVGTDFAAREKAVKDYLAGQLSAGETAITGAGTQGATAISEAEKALLAQLTAPTAYQNVPLAMTTPEMQALGQQLAAYGASGEQAAAARQESTDYARQLADIQAREMGQLNTAQQNYMTALRNAGVGAGAAARQGLAGNVASQLAALRGGIAANQATTLSDLASARGEALRGITQSEQERAMNAEDLRQQLLTKGFETGLAGRQARAEAEAGAIKEFGVPKKKKGKVKK